MIDQAAPRPSTEHVAAALRDELARADAGALAVAPILRQLISAPDVSVFSEETVSRVRSMLADLAAQLLGALTGDNERVHSSGEVDVLGGALLDDPALLSHLHALAMEAQLTERLHARLALDPVMTPAIRAALAAAQPAVQQAARAFLAAQARWSQSQRRMQLALCELPADLLNVALYTLHALAGVEPALARQATEAETRIRDTYDAQQTRLALAERLVRELGSDASNLLKVTSSGVSLFLTAVAQAAAQNREAVVLSTHEAQLARFALTLRAADLPPAEVEEQFLVFHPEVMLPIGFERIDAGQALHILASRPGSGHYS